jgi:hypothetical protein
VEDSFAPDLTTNIATTDFDAFGPYGTYTPLITITGNGWISATLDSTALISMSTSSIFKVMIVGGGDYTGTPPASETEEFDTFDFSGNVPYIEYFERKILNIDNKQTNLISKIFNINISSIYNLKGKVLQ